MKQPKLDKCCFCNNPKQYLVEYKAKQIPLCKECCKDIFKLLSKHLVPKSPTSLFITNQTTIKGE